jgi:hypothetical protein
MTTLLPHCERAIVDIRKIEGYCLDDRALLVEFSDDRERAYAVSLSGGGPAGVALCAGGGLTLSVSTS